MTQEWAIALLGITLSVMTAILAWMAGTITGIRRDLQKCVQKEDCNRAMDTHCEEIRTITEEIRNVWKDIGKNDTRIAHLENLTGFVPNVRNINRS